MCGIAGMIDLSSAKRSAPRGAVKRMADALLHRGPDEEGYLDQPGLHLGMRRLSIVGLADGQQPISNEAKTVWTVFNGEFFDHLEVRKDLEASGHTFRTHTDTEIIPHLWEDHGTDLWKHLRGQFALCLWDSRSNEFVLGRDRAGIAPLYYTTQLIDGAPWLLFASEMKALFASGFVRAEANHAGLSHIFTFFAQPGPATVFKDIYQVLPGRYLHVKPGNADLTQRTYWEVNYPDQGHENYGRNEAATVDKFEELLYAAVERRLRADVPVVSYLSGGVDSSLVVAMACKVLGRPLPTFTVSVKKDGLNEDSEALETAKYLNCQPVMVPCGDDELRADYPALIRAAEFPVVDTACLGLMHLARAVRNNGYKVALTGEGADEWLAGYPWFKLSRMAKVIDCIPGLGFGVRTLAMKLLGSPTYSYKDYSYPETLFGGRHGWLDAYGMMSLNKLRFFTGDLRKFALGTSAFDDIELSANIKRWHPFHRQMYVGAKIMLPGHLLASKGDRVALSQSVETRYPFLDEELVEYMATLHPRWKLRGLFKDKFIERKVAERWLPKQIAWRKKLMFRAPMDSWVGNTATSPWIDEVLSPESLLKTGYFDVVAVQAARTRLASGKKGLGRAGLEMGLTAVMATQLWHHTYIKADLCSLPGFGT